MPVPLRFRFIVLTALPAIAAGCTHDSTGAGDVDDNVVNVYNWADYIAPDTVDKFEAEYGVKVNYDIYDSSEVIDVKMLAGNSGYDVVVHSSQFSSRLVPIGVYEKLDYSRLPNIRNLDPELMKKLDVYPSTHGYTVPYHWGTTGYAWNVEMVRERLPDHPMDSADILFEPELISRLADCGVSFLDGATDVFPLVLAYLGRDPNAVDDESLALAEEKLKAVRPYVRYFSNQMMMTDLPNKEICVAMSWSGDYIQAAKRAKEAGIDVELRYTMPKEGTGLWVDGLYIPADAPHKDNAYKFINFLLRADIAADIVNEVYYANSNRASWELLSPEILQNPDIFPNEETWKIMFPVLNGDPKQERPRTRAFASVKAGL